MIKLDVNGALWTAEMHISNMIKDRSESDPDWERLVEDELAEGGFGRIGDTWVINVPRLLLIQISGSEYARVMNQKDAVDTGGAYYRTCSVLKAE